MDYKLIYVNRVGYNYKGEGTYELIFADNTIDLKDVWGEGWIEIPADSRAQSPDIEHISKVGTFQAKDYDFTITNDSIEFGICDAKDDVIALAWEAIDENFDPNKTRLVFRFGDDLKDVEKKIKNRRLTITYDS